MVTVVILGSSNRAEGQGFGRLHVLSLDKTAECHPLHRSHHLVVERHLHEEAKRIGYCLASCQRWLSGLQRREVEMLALVQEA